MMPAPDDTRQLGVCLPHGERFEQGEDCPTCAAAVEGRLCGDCGHLTDDHLSADECQDHGIDSRDGLGCAVVTRVSPASAHGRFVRATFVLSSPDGTPAGDVTIDMAEKDIDLYTTRGGVFPAQGLIVDDVHVEQPPGHRHVCPWCDREFRAV